MLGHGGDGTLKKLVQGRRQATALLKGADGKHLPISLLMSDKTIQHVCFDPTKSQKGEHSP